MKDFIQVGQPHSEWSISNSTAIIPIIIGFTFLVLMVVATIDAKKKSQLKGENVTYIVISGAFGAFMMIAGTIWMVHEYRTYSHITDYEGTFKVVQSEADKIDTTTTDSDDKRKITLEDKQGNQQVFEVSDNQIFHKGGKAVVKVKSQDKKPSLDKKLGQEDYETNDFEIISIKPEKQD